MDEIIPSDDLAGLSPQRLEEILEQLGGMREPPAPDPRDDPPPVDAPPARPAVAVELISPLGTDALRGLVDAVPDALVVVDNTGRIVLVNRQTEELFGYPRGELLGLPVETLLPERFRESHVGKRDGYFKEPEIRPMGKGRELVGRRKDGHEVPVEISLSPLFTDTGVLVVSSIRDVSERRKAEGQRRKMEKRYQTLVEGIPAVTFMAAMDDSDERELYVSPQIEELLGFSQKEWLENPILWYTQLHPDDRMRWHKEFAHTCSTGERFRSVYRFVARNGRIVWVHGEAQMVKDDDGQPLFLQGVAFDVTGIKEAAEELKALNATLEELNATLEERVAERTAEAEARAKELARSNKDLELFAYVAAHDLRAPLSTLNSQLQAMETKFRDRFDATDRETHIATSQKSANDMRALIDGLFEFSQVRTEGKEFAPTSCEEAVATACNRLQDAIDQSGAQIEWEQLPVVLADGSQLKRLFQNLIGNSLKFRLADQAPQVRITACRDGANWVVTVTDNGIGIEAVRLKSVNTFEKIFKLGVESRQHKKYPGSGVGLATCKNIVERHNGRIWAHSDGKGKGTTISFTLPAAGE